MDGYRPLKKQPITFEHINEQDAVPSAYLPLKIFFAKKITVSEHFS